MEKPSPVKTMERTDEEATAALHAGQSHPNAFFGIKALPPAFLPFWFLAP